MMADVTPPPAIVAEAAPASQGQFLMQEIATPEGPRRFKLYVPSRYESGRPAPLLVVLHGCTQDPDDVARGTRFNALAEEANMLVAYPEQPQKANGLKCWNWFDPAHQKRNQGEPALIAAITQRVIGDYTVDARRVYIAGLSAGGAMALTTAYAYPEIFAAVAIHSGIAYGTVSSPAEAIKAMGAGAADPAGLAAAVVKGMGSTRYFPAIVFQGASDRSVNVVNASQIVEQLTQSFAPRPLEKLSEVSGETEGGYHFTKQVYGNGCLVVEKWVVSELGHAWSGGSKDGTYTDPKGPDASREMLRFLMEHPRN
ncbi:MAG: PHB depolymerase family esterase [Gemmatimonadaceae bacterium]|nr:PHB depolymerase family esterase [Gemmatimonadaceae bacterium]